MSRPGWFTRRAVLAVLACAALGAVAVEQSLIHRARAQHDRLRELLSDRAGAREPRALKTEDHDEKKAQLQAANRHLPRLRNEVRQLREQHLELVKLRTQVTRLRTGRAPGARPGPGPAANGALRISGFIGREQMSDSGLTTPELAVQTFFWAMCHGQMERLAQCVTEEIAGQFSSNPGNPVEERAAMIKKEMAGLPGLKIEPAQPIPGSAVGEVSVNVRTSESGKAIQLRLRPVGAEWRISNPP
jgi:hypothetical protein